MPGTKRNAAKKSYTLGRKEVFFDLEVPSGALCQVRRPGPMGLIEAGLLDNIDILGSLIQTEHVDRVNGRAPASEEDDRTKQLRQAQELMRDPAKLKAATSMIDKVLCHVVVQPEIHLPVPPEERDPDKVYSDSVEWEDKMFIFDFVLGGAADIATFRQKQQEIMGDLAAGEAVQDSTQQAPGGE